MLAHSALSAIPPALQIPLSVAATMKALPKSLWASIAKPAASYPSQPGDVMADCVIVEPG